MTDDVSVVFGADTDRLQSGINAAMQPIGTFKERVADLNAAMNATAPAMQKAGQEIEGLNFKTAGATQEFIRIGHEVLTGNFSRIPGSLIVLTERMGGLQSVMQFITPATLGWGAAIAVTVGAIYELISASQELQQTQNTIAGAYDLAGRSLSYNADQVDRNIAYMRQFESVSRSEAEAISILFARTSTLTDQAQKEIIKYIDAWKQVTGEKDTEEAAKNLAKIFTDPAKGAAELAKKFPELVSAEEALKIQQDETANGAQHAADLFLDDIGPKLAEFNKNYVQPSVGYWESLKRAVDKFNEAGIFGLFNQGLKANVPVEPPSEEQQALIDAQQHQLQLNNEELAGLEIVRQTHGANEEINKLLDERKTLVTAISASQEKGDLDQTVKYEDAVKDVDAKILAEKKRMNAEATADAKRALEQQISAEREAANTKIALSKINIQTKKDELEAEVSAGQISRAKEITGLQELANEEYNLNYQALQDELALDGQTVAQKQAIYDKIQILYANHQREMAQIAKQGIEDEKREADQFFNVIDRDLDSMLSGVLQGTQTWKQAEQKAFADLATSAIESIAKIALRWAAFKASSGIFGAGSGITQGIGSGLPSFLSGGGKDVAETANTTALTALNTNIAALNVALGANTTTTLSASQIDALCNVSTQANTASTELNSLSTDSNSDGLLLSALRWAENTIATLANTIATDAAAIGKFLSFDVGSSSVPSTGLAMIHKGEIILPPDISAQVRSGNATIGAQGGFGGVSIPSSNVNVNMGISAIDAKSFINLINNPSIMRQLSKNIGGYMAQNPSARGAY